MISKVYWNNVCLLSNFEEEYINNILIENKLQKKVDFSYYGLGREYSLKEFFDKHPYKTLNFHSLISTDVDIFQHKDYLKDKVSSFKNLSNNSLNKIVLNSNIFSIKEFLPFIIIPLVMVVNKDLIPHHDIPNSLEDLLKEKYKGKVCFGGIHTSAGGSLFKALIYLFGWDKALEFTKNSIITSMPAGAFFNVMQGNYPIAIVPTIFARRCGLNNLEFICPKEGAIAIPSYIAINKNIDSFTEDFLLNNLLSSNFQKELYEKGAIIPCHKDLENISEDYITSLLYPNEEFLSDFDFTRFYKTTNELYNSI